MCLSITEEECVGSLFIVDNFSAKFTEQVESVVAHSGQDAVQQRVSGLAAGGVKAGAFRS